MTREKQDRFLIFIKMTLQTLVLGHELGIFNSYARRRHRRMSKGESCFASQKCLEETPSCRLEVPSRGAIDGLIF